MLIQCTQGNSSQCLEIFDLFIYFLYFYVVNFLAKCWLSMSVVRMTKRNLLVASASEKPKCHVIESEPLFLLNCKTNAKILILHNNHRLIFVYEEKVKHFREHLINYGNKYLFVFSDSVLQ